jgi:Family of unknown function (DUF6298)/Putative collagen-binding domain of a collagenase
MTTGQVSPATGPLRVDASNPRYFTDGSGKAIYLTGSHTWNSLQDRGESYPPRPFDFAAYLDFLQDHNHNFIRLWVWENAKWAPWTKEAVFFEPLAYQRTGPGNAIDGRPRFDLTKLNEAYFQRLRARVVAARERGIYVSVMLFQGWSVDGKGLHKGNPWPGHPFHKDNNVNGINGDKNGNGEGEEVHTLENPSVTRLQEAYVRKIIDTVNDLGNVLYEISNESADDATGWQYHMINYIHEYEAGKPKQHPVLMSIEWERNHPGKNAELFRSPAEAISPNSDGGYKKDPPPADGSKVIISDTDHLWGVGGDQGWVWKSFVRGLNPIFMDPYGRSGGSRGQDSKWELTRRNMGYTLAYARRMNLEAMEPRGDLASTSYCLADPASEYLVYSPAGGSVTVDLSAASGPLSVEWFNPRDGQTRPGGTTEGGASRTFRAPFPGDAVLYIRRLKH